ncbi:MAG: DUF6232 family protein [Longimicrobiales bacterium]
MSDSELYSAHNVRVTGSMFVVGRKQYAIRDITAVAIEYPNGTKLAFGFALYGLVFVLAMLGGLPSLVVRVIIIAHIAAGSLYVLALIVGWSVLILALLAREDARGARRVVTITIGRRRVPVLTSSDEQHVKAVARALGFAMRHVGDDRRPS